MRQRPFVLEHLSEIATIDPASTRRTPDEVFGLEQLLTSLTGRQRPTN
jgi:hypothetical protein